MRFCAVIPGPPRAGAIRTLCRGSWSERDTVEEIGLPEESLRCGGCLRTLNDPVELGLLELQTAVSTDLREAARKELASAAVSELMARAPAPVVSADARDAARAEIRWQPDFHDRFDHGDAE